MNKDAILKSVRDKTFDIYKNAPHALPFHGWHHIEFVRKQALRFCDELGADKFLVEVAAYVHDLNYVAKEGSDVADGQNLRRDTLAACGLDNAMIDTIEDIVTQGSTGNRKADIPAEAKALSDGDTLFKVLPITPILFARLFMDEKSQKIGRTARGIVERQKPLLEKNIYFYSKGASHYMKWAKTNMDLWENVMEYLDDPVMAIGETGIDALDRYL